MSLTPFSRLLVLAGILLPLLFPRPRAGFVLTPERTVDFDNSSLFSQGHGEIRLIRLGGGDVGVESDRGGFFALGLSRRNRWFRHQHSGKEAGEKAREVGYKAEGHPLSGL